MENKPGIPINASEMEQHAISVANRKSHLFQPGNTAGVGNHKPRTRLSNRFVSALTEEFKTRGVEALQDLDSKTLISTCVAVLPKDVLISLEQTDTVRFIVSSDPVNTLEWMERHNLRDDTQVIESIDED